MSTKSAEIQPNNVWFSRQVKTHTYPTQTVVYLSLEQTHGNLTKEIDLYSCKHCLHLHMTSVMINKLLLLL